MSSGQAYDVGLQDSGQRRTAWHLVYALAGLQLVVTLGWTAYGYFQPRLLEGFGLTAFSTPLALYLGIVGATLAPIIGAAGDRLARRNGTRAPLIVAGGLLAGGTFVAVASTVTVQPAGVLRWGLLGLIAFWIAAMTVLQAPALAILPASTGAERWPVVASPLVVATVLPYALWPILRQSLDRLGGPLVFGIGGVAVVIATLALRGAMAAPNVSLACAGPEVSEPLGSGPALLAGAFLLGGLSAFVTRLTAEVVPGVLASSVGSASTTSEILAAISLSSSSVFAPTLAPVAASVGQRRSLGVSVVAAVLCVAAAPLCGSIFTAAAVVVLMGAALALCLDCALPCAFELLPSGAHGLSAGLYLGGVFAGSQLAGLAMRVG